MDSSETLPLGPRPERSMPRPCESSRKSAMERSFMGAAGRAAMSGALSHNGYGKGGGFFLMAVMDRW